MDTESRTKLPTMFGVEIKPEVARSGLFGEKPKLGIEIISINLLLEQPEQRLSGGAL